MSSQLFYQCQVLSVDDPLMLGRVRGRRLIDNYDDELKAINDPPWNESTDAWTIRDPFVFMPLLPYYIYQTPKVDEMILVMYTTPEVKYSNKYYVQSTFYSPTSSNFQYYQGANKFMGTGVQISNPKPLKNPDGTYSDKKRHKGVFPEPGDNALMGRGSADVIVKQDEVILRAGKFLGSNLKPNILPSANQRRGFLQLSRFSTEKISLPDKTIRYIKETPTQIRYLIEYHILNPENTMDMFSGYVFLYQLKPSQETNSLYFSVTSKVSDKNRILSVTQEFSNLSLNQTIDFINNFIEDCNNKNTSDGGVRLFSSNDKFPIYYRPQLTDYLLMTNPSSFTQTANPNIKCVGDLVINGDYCYLNLHLVNSQTNANVYTLSSECKCENSAVFYNDIVSKMMQYIQQEKLGYIPIPTLEEIEQGIEPMTVQYSNDTASKVQENISSVYKKIRLNSSAIEPGHGLIYKKGVVGKPTKIEEKKESQSDTIASYKTYGAIGADYVYLLSHLSSIPNRKQINFDDTLYGITQEKFFSEIEPNTCSFVRGEPLLELINQMYLFLRTHVHPFPGKSPVPVTTTAFNVSELETSMRNAYENVLNTYIRIN